MKKMTQRGLALLTVGAVIVGTTLTAGATSIPGFAGVSQQPGQSTCFTNNNGAITNSCGPTAQYCIPLPVSSSGHDVKLTVTAPDINHNVTCFDQAVYSGSQYSSRSANYQPSIFGSPSAIDLGSVNVPTSGALWACCNMEPGSTINSVNY